MKLRILYVTTILAALVGCLTLLTSCAESAPRPGTAQAQAATATARAETDNRAADTAAVEAAAKQAKAQELERQAIATPTPELIRRAADARVEAASASAVAAALHRVADEAEADAAAAAKRAASERAAEAQAADDRWWRMITRIAGAAGIVLGILIGGITAKLIDAKTGAFLGLLLAGSGLVVALYGAAFTWLLILLGVALVLAIVVWSLHHRRQIAELIDLIDLPSPTAPPKA